VIRSSRMPPGMAARNVPEAETPPEGIPVATGGVRHGPIDSDSEDDIARAGPSRPGDGTAGVAAGERANLVDPVVSEDDEDYHYRDDPDTTRISDIPPSLPGIEVGGDIELPSRLPSKASTRHAREPATLDIPLVPSLPRKSSRRKSQSLDLTVRSGAPGHRPQSSLDSRLPFNRSNSNKDPSNLSTTSSMAAAEDPADAGQSSSVSGAIASHVADDRPASMGYVHHHSIRTVDPGETPAFQGSAAEVIDERPTPPIPSSERRPE